MTGHLHHHPELLLSEDLTGMRHGERLERIDCYCFVLGSQGFDSGALSWDVAVGDKVFGRKGDIGLQSRLWGVGLYQGECTTWSIHCFLTEAAPEDQSSS